MSKSEVIDAIKRASKIVNRYDERLKELDKDVVIFSGIVFTSDTDYYYIFSIYKDNKLVSKVRANDSKEYDKVFADLTNKYEVNILTRYDDLNSNQIKYLIDTDAPKVDRAELETISLNNALNMFG